jgi:nucleoside-diphosphate-sugar epimerase
MRLIFGNGYVGNLLKEYYGETSILSPVDITDAVKVKEVLDQVKPKYVFNAAGKTGKPNVDWCETNRSVTYNSNVTGPMVLAEILSEMSIPWMHIGSGCIFYGDPPRDSGWLEEDLANPLSFYSKSKYAADLLLSHYDNVCIARIRMPISGKASDRNLLVKLSKYNTVVNALNSVSVLEDCIPAMSRLCDIQAKGVFHLTNPGPVHHSQIINVMRKYNFDYQPSMITLEEFEASGLVVAARSNAVLNTSKLEKHGIKLPDAISSIEKCVSRIWRP